MPQRHVEEWLSVQNLSAELLVFKRVSPTDNCGLLHLRMCIHLVIGNMVLGLGREFILLHEVECICTRMATFTRWH